jgi:lipid-A-disaccharide synthase
MLVIFPFEEPFYREHGVEAEFVGHPLADLPLPSISRADFARFAGLDPGRSWIALLPGSRAREIRHNLPTMLAAALDLPEAYDFILPVAPTLTGEQRASVQSAVDRLRGSRTVRLVQDTGGQGETGSAPGSARAALFHARASIVASGTATVEAALMGKPFVVVYRVSPITYAIARRVVTVPHVAMANLIAGRRIVPELIQDQFTAANIVQQMEPLLSEGLARESMMEELRRVRTLLSTRPEAKGGASGSIDRVAAVALECLGVSSPVAESVQS